MEVAHHCGPVAAFLPGPVEHCRGGFKLEGDFGFGRYMQQILEAAVFDLFG